MGSEPSGQDDKARRPPPPPAGNPPGADKRHPGGWRVQPSPEQGRPFIASLLLGFGPTILLVALFLWFARRAASQAGGGLMGIGRARAKRFEGTEQRVTFDDVAGIDEAKQELAEIVDFLKNPDKYRRLGGRIPRGVLLSGPPGTGKTLLARAVAGEAHVPFFS